MTDIPVRTPDGMAGTIPEADLPSALTQGFRPLAPEEVVNERARQAIAADALGPVRAGMSSLAQGFSFGAYEPVRSALTEVIAGPEAAKEFRRDFQLLQQEYPLSSVVGEAAGMLFPAKALTKAAEKVAAKATAGIASTGLRATANLAVREAVEGAMQSAGGYVTEASLTDKDIAVEDLLLQTMTGSALGLVGGGVVGAGMQGAGKLARKASEAFSRRESGLARAVENIDIDTPALAAEAAPLARAESDVSPLAAKYIERIDDPEQRALAKEYARLRTQQVSAEEAVDLLTRETVPIADEFLSTQVYAREALHGGAKTQKMAELVDTPVPEKPISAVLSFRDKVKSKLEWFSDVYTSGDEKGIIKRMQNSIDTFDKKMVGTIELGSRTIDEARATFAFADDLKRALSDGAAYGKKEVASDFNKEFDALYKEARTMLEDPMWGRAADAQRTNNKATSEMLNVRRIFDKLVTNEETGAGGYNLRKVKTAELKSFLMDPDSIEKMRLKDAVQRTIAAQAEQIEMAQKYWPLSPAEMATFKKSQETIRKFQAQLQKAEDSASVISAMNKRLALEKEFVGTLGNRPIVGIASNYLTNQVTTAGQIADLERNTRKLLTRVDESVKKFISSPSSPYRSTAPQSREQVREVARKVMNEASNPVGFASKVQQAMKGVASAAPKVAAEVSLAANRAIHFLREKAPKDRSPYATLTPQFYEPTYSDADIDKFSRYFRAVTNPMELLDGNLSREAVEAWKAVYPTMYARVRERMLQEIATRKTPMEYDKLLQLGILLGAQTHPTMMPQFLRIVQNAKAVQQQEQPKPRRDIPAKILTAADNLRSPSERTELGVQ